MGWKVAKSSFTFSFNKLPKDFLLLVVLIVIFEVMNMLFDDHFYSPPFYGLRMKIKNELSLNKKNHFDILIFGDSYNIAGINSNTIEQNTGLSCYNFSTHIWQTILASFCMFNNYLKTCTKKPKFIIIGFIPKSCLITKNDVVKNYVPYLYDFTKGNMSVLNKEFGVIQVLKFLIPSLKHQYYFKSFFETPYFLRVRKIQSRRQIDSFIQQVSADKGYYAWHGDEVFDGTIDNDASYSGFTISDFFNKYLRLIFDLAKNNNIKLVYLIPTSSPDYYNLWVKEGVMRKYSDFIFSLKKEYPNLIIVDPQFIVNKKELYADASHLNRNGARLLSNFLSEKINAVWKTLY